MSSAANEVAACWKVQLEVEAAEEVKSQRGKVSEGLEERQVENYLEGCIADRVAQKRKKFNAEATAGRDDGRQKIRSKGNWRNERKTRRRKTANAKRRGEKPSKNKTNAATSGAAFIPSTNQPKREMVDYSGSEFLVGEFDDNTLF